MCVRRRGSAYARANTRRRLGEDDERDVVLARYYVSRKLGFGDGEESRSSSAASSPPRYNEFTPQQGHARSPSANGGNIYGGGTMPGPQYLLNMHPGVPVHRW